MKKEKKVLSYEEKYIQEVDSDYGFAVAKKLLEFKTNPYGFRLAGTPAENEAADWIAQEMKDIGLQEVAKVGFPVDAWEFKGAQVIVSTPSGELTPMEVGSFSCLEGTTDKGLDGEVVYVGDGTALNYNELNVKDKIVLIDTDAYHTFWYNSLFAQAEIRGAKAVIATVVAGAGTYKDNLITTQDVLGRVNIPAVMMTKKDGDKIRTLLIGKTPLTANIKADIKITRNAEANYVYGKIVGKNPNSYIIVGGHYDAYWDGFQDNASSLGTQLTMAKAMIDSGYRPENTFIFITNGAEECGKSDSKYAFLAGANAIIKNHPDWVANTIIYNNFELTAMDQIGKFIVVGSPCYRDILSKLVKKLNLSNGYEFYPIPEAMADDIVFSNAGIPTFGNVSVYWGGDDPNSHENYDHTQYDSVETYDSTAFDFNNKTFGLLNMAIDKMPLAPLDFTSYATHYWNDVDKAILKTLYYNFEQMDDEINAFCKKAEKTYESQIEVNNLFKKLKDINTSGKEIEKLYNVAWKVNKSMLKINKELQDKVFKLDAFNSIIYGHIQPYNYVTTIDALIKELKAGKAGESLKGIQELDNNYLIALFDKGVYERIAIEAFNPSVPQSWGTGKTLPFPDMYDVITSINEKIQKGGNDFKPEIIELQKIRDAQYSILIQTLDSELSAVQLVNKMFDGIDIQSIIDNAKNLIK